MAVLQDQNPSSSYAAPPSDDMKMEIRYSKNSSCLELVPLNNVVNANAKPLMMVESRKRKKPTRVTVESLYDSPQTQSSVMERAKAIEASLDPNFPALHKIMMPSQVTGGFCLGLPKTFRSQHLPQQDAIIVLESENGKEFETKYLVEKGGLSGGWRGFSIAHKILPGDIVIFQLVTSVKFKVYIVRTKEVNCGPAPIRFDACTQPMDTGDNACGREERENLEPIPEEKQMVIYTNSGPTSELSENDSEDPGFEFLDGLRLSESDVTFKEVKSMKNFNVVVNGLIINSEFSIYVLTKYYELCCSQNSFLHEHLLEGLNCKLIGGVISETINIADAIRSCKITTSEDNFSIWGKTLKAFEDLGMNVGFLHARLDKLATIASKSKSLIEAVLEKDLENEEMKSSETKHLEANETINRLDSDIETLELMFQEVAKAPW